MFPGEKGPLYLKCPSCEYSSSKQDVPTVPQYSPSLFSNSNSLICQHSSDLTFSEPNNVLQLTSLGSGHLSAFDCLMLYVTQLTAPLV